MRLRKGRLTFGVKVLSSTDSQHERTRGREIGTEFQGLLPLFRGTRIIGRDALVAAGGNECRASGGKLRDAAAGGLGICSRETCFGAAVGRADDGW